MRHRLTAISETMAWWARYRHVSLHLAIAVMALLALLKLGVEFRRLLFETDPSGAVDLRFFHRQVANWFARGDLQADFLYPPASLPLFALLGIGWLGDTGSRWLCAVGMVAFACLFGRLMVKESGANSALDRVFVLMMLLSMNATGVMLGNGQVTLHVLLFVTASILSLDRAADWWRARTLLAMTALLVSLVKPSVSVPFFALALVRRNGFRTVAVVAAGYVALTLFAARVQDEPLLSFLRNSISAGRAAVAEGGYANLDNWLSAMGWSDWSLAAASVALAALIGWLIVHRHADLWVLLGVTAIVARLWTYHRVYDDMLILLPMIALYRIARDDRSSPETARRAGLLLGVTVVAMLAPARLEHLPFPWHLPFTAGHALVWLAIGGFLAQQAQARGLTARDGKVRAPAPSRATRAIMRIVTFDIRPRAAIVAVALLCATQVVAQPADPPPDQFFDSNSVRLRYVDQGSGPAIVLMHGYTGTLDRHFLANGVFANLVRDHRVVAFDLRGHGKSGKPHEAGAYGEEMARDVVRLLDHLKIERAHVIGYSLGAMIAGHLAALNPDRLISVAFVAQVPLRELTSEMATFAEQSVKELESDLPFRSLALALQPPGSKTPSDDELRKAMAPLVAANDVKALAALWGGYRRLLTPDADLAAVNVPMMALIGSEDRNAAAVPALVQAHPRIRTLVVPGAEHGGTQGVMRRPEFMTTLRAFLAAAR